MEYMKTKFGFVLFFLSIQQAVSSEIDKQCKFYVDVFQVFDGVNN